MRWILGLGGGLVNLTLLFSAEPNGPFRTCPVTTEVVAAPLQYEMVE